MSLYAWYGLVELRYAEHSVEAETFKDHEPPRSTRLLPPGKLPIVAPVGLVWLVSL